MNKNYIKENILKIIIWVLGLGAIGLLLIFSIDSFNLSDPSDILLLLFDVLILIFGLNALVIKLTSSSDKLLCKYYNELTVNPDSATAYMEIARYYITAVPQKPCDIDKVLQYIDKAIELDPNLAEAYLLRALLYYKENYNKEAFKDIEKVLELEPDNEMALDFKKDLLDAFQT